MLKKQGHVMLPLPPYSPDFNPIEQSFGSMKKRRKGMPIQTTVEEFARTCKQRIFFFFQRSSDSTDIVFMA
ncbi:MAG: hypothetical protein CO093_00105 [Alphaproteobacteria bacterium CG_4_9_14_3_um_filter_47_13]|nr:MAG: hypothetical protein CO093_00105 [Alphaproteobacteria bacterium CG_4_9_14_3_um_filter_47_13]